MTLHAEFQAVVLAAGRGSRMQEITTNKPKSLLPIGTKPLIWYPIFKLQQIGFTDVIVVVLENQRSDVQAVLDRFFSEIRIDYFHINNDKDLGTADTLRLLSDRLKSDVVVVSCDLITDIDLVNVLNTFRMNDASIVSLLYHQQSQKSSNQLINPVPGPKIKHKPERDLIGVDSQTNRLIFLASASDYEDDLKLPSSLLNKHTHIKIYSDLIDSHFYILKNWIIKYLANQTSFTTIKGEFLPHIIKKQLSKSINNGSDDIFKYAKEDDFALLIRETSAYNDHKGDLKATYHGDSIRCYAYLADPDIFGIRVNTLPNYWNINNQILDRWPKITGGLEHNLKHERAEIKSTQVDDKCTIWEGVKLQEKTSFKNSTIGSNTKISSFSRVFNSIVMNNVTIKEKVALENCIVCDGAIIESGSQITNCLIGSHHTVVGNSKYNHEVLTDTDRLMEF